MKKKQCTYFAGFVICLGVSLAHAAGGNPAGVSPMTPERAPGMPALHVPNDSDRLFVQQAGIGGMSEVENSKIASRQAEGAPVKAFAQRMIDDHGKANQQLASVASAAHLAVPDTLDMSHRVAADDLRKRRGVDFDRTYLGQQIAAHQETLQLLEWQLGAGQDDALKDFAKQTIPVVLDHLRHAIDLQQQLAIAAPIPPDASERAATRSP